MKSSNPVETATDPHAGPAADAETVRRAHRALDILAAEHDRIGLAVSGGSDSTALLVLASDWARAHGKLIRVATVDHGLRPEAAAEAEGVAALAHRLGLAHDTLRWRPETTHVTQASARTARHDLLAIWARAHDLPLVAMGHTRDDRVETFLMRARAGSGWRGLAGPMPAAASPAGRLRIIRPLLALARRDLRRRLLQRGHGWIEDPSNRMMRHERVRMRALAGDRLGEPTCGRIIRTMDGLAAMRAAVTAAAREALETKVDAASGQAMLDAAAFRALDREPQLRLAEALVMAAGGAARLPDAGGLDRLARRMAEPGGLQRGATLAGAWIAETRGALRIRRAPPRRASSGVLNQSRPVPMFDLERAEALLADPRIGALFV